MKPRVHFLPNELLNAPQAISVSLIGAGGTGSQVLTRLARMNHAMNALGHPGLHLAVFDDDTVTEANLGRQLFAEAELGLNKAAALVNRTNRFFGTSWRAVPRRFRKGNLSPRFSSNIFISCVDTVRARLEIAEVVRSLQSDKVTDRSKAYYWLDFGNSQQSGQVILSTVGPLQQPDSEIYETREQLPFVTDEYADLLAAADEDDTPSCSLAEALTKQDLYINDTLAALGCGLLWSLFRQGMTENRGVFLNLSGFRSQPLKV